MVEGRQLLRRAVDDQVAKMYITDLRDEDIELSVKVVTGDPFHNM